LGFDNPIGAIGTIGNFIGGLFNAVGGLLNVLLLPFKFIGAMFGFLGKAFFPGSSGSGGFLDTLTGLIGGNKNNAPAAPAPAAPSIPAPTPAAAPQQEESLFAAIEHKLSDIFNDFGRSPLPTPPPPANENAFGVSLTNTGAYINQLSAKQQKYVHVLKGTEGTGKNPKSSASGEYQFIDDTWRFWARRCAKDYHDPAYAKFADAGDAELNALKKHNSDFKDYCFIRFTKHNAAGFRNSTGQQPTDGWLYMCHQQGLSAAVAAYKNPEAKMYDLLLKIDPKNARDAILNNGGKLDMTAAEFSHIWTRRFDGPSARVAAAAPNV
jgi:hypothetical protein